MHLKQLITSFVLPLLVIVSAITQPALAREAVNTVDHQSALEALNKNGLTLLDEIITEAPMLRLAENRAMMQSIAADLLWAHDEQRARALFSAAIVNVDEITNGVPFGDLQYESLLQERQELRQSVLEMVARHDAQLARKLLRTTIQPAQEPDAELHLELSLAAQMVANDPRQAARFAEETLERGIAGQLANLIAQIQAKDPEAAARLAGAVVTKLRSTRLAANEEATGVAFNLFHLSTEPPASPLTGASPAPLLDQPSMQALANMIVSVALSTSADNADLLLALQPLLADVERYAPARVPLVRRKLAQLTKVSGKPVSSSLDAVQEGGDDEDKLEAAAKAGREGEARQLLETLRTPEERVTVLVQLAKTMTKKNEKKHAVELLEEAHVLVSSRAQNFAQFDAQLQVACAFAPLDPGRSFGIIEPMVDQLNELANAAVIVDGFITEAQLARNDELELKSVSDYLDSLSDENAEDFALLTQTRFDDMKRVVNRFQRNELRILARLILVRIALTQSSALTYQARITKSGSAIGVSRRS